MQQAGSPYAIELNTAMLPRLMAEIAVGAKAGREVGGLLSGSFPRTADITIRIDDLPFWPVLSECVRAGLNG